MRIFAVPTALLLLLTGLCAIVRADEESIPLDKLPKAATETLKAKFPRLKMAEAVKDTTDGEVTYQVTLRRKDKDVDVTLTEEGQITLIEREIDENQFPPKAKRAIRALHPHATFDWFAEVTDFEEDEHGKKYFEAVLILPTKKKVSISVTAEGEILSEEDEKEPPAREPATK